jgi:uncharacterized protein
MWQTVVVAIAIAVGAGSAQAQAQTQTQTKKDLIAKLLQLQQPGIENIGRALAGQTSQRVLQAAGQAMPRIAADKREAVGKDVQADVKKFYDEIEPVLRKRAAELAPVTLAPVYEEKFSEDELKTVIAWLESPVSKKFQQIDADLANTLAQKVVADTRGSVETRLKTLETSLAKKLGVTPPPSAGSASGPKK